MIKTPRATAEHLGSTRVKFTFPCGHTKVEDFGTGPVAKRWGESGTRLMVKWWQSAGVTYECARCAQRLPKPRTFIKRRPHA